MPSEQKFNGKANPVPKMSHAEGGCVGAKDTGFTAQKLIFDMTHLMPFLKAEAERSD